MQRPSTKTVVKLNVHIAICTLHLLKLIIIHRYDILKGTWNEEPEKRPCFADIVQILYVAVNNSKDSVNDIENHSDYLDVLANSM